MSVYLGVDYGKKHIGVAVADGPLASPLASLSLSDHLAADLCRLAKRHSATGIVIGLPEGSLQAEIISFRASLAKVFSGMVALHPETLSTKEAVAALRAGGASRKKLQNDHVYAACLILEDYLESAKLEGIKEV